MNALFRVEVKPTPDLRAHRCTRSLESWFSDLSQGPKHRGTIELLMARSRTTERTLYTKVELFPGEPLGADRWRPGKNGLLDQISVMNHNVAHIIANGQPHTMFGDNISLNLDLSEENLPVGARLRVGQALCEVTSEPHTGCSLYQARFGKDSLRYISAKSRTNLRMRGVHFQVIEAGVVCLSDEVVVVFRPSLASANLP